MLFNAFKTLFIIILLLIFKVHVLDEACKHHPHAWWWVKADGCDLVSGLAESVSEIWHGDVDLNNGELEAHYTAYQSRLQDIRNLTMATYPNRLRLCQQLASFIHDIENDLEFLHTGQFCYLDQLINHYIFIIS